MKLAQDRHVRLAIVFSAIAIAIRFIAINQPFIDEWSWRQSDVASIARNFFNGGFHFARPQIDWAGGEPGYVGTEFPILPFLAALVYKIFGVNEWIGRSESVLFFSASLPFFFLLVREIFGPRAAAYALFFYSFAPLSVMASRCFIPDIPSLSLSIIGLYFFKKWLTNERSTSYFVSALCISLSILIKAPSAIIGAPLAIAALAERRRFLPLLGFAAIALVPSAVWYWHAHRIAQQFYPNHFFGAGGFKIENPAWYFALVRRMFLSSFTPILFSLGLIGIVAARSTSGARPLYAWLGAMILFFIVAGYGNRHPWYQLSFVPILAAFAGNFCARLRFAWLIAPAFVLCAIVPARNLYRESAAQLREAGLEIKRVTPPGSLVIAPDYGDPTIFYYAERRGWHFLEANATYNGHPTNESDAIVDLDALRGRGATHVVFYPDTFWWLTVYPGFARHLEDNSTLLEATDRTKIYKLN